VDEPGTREQEQNIEKRTLVMRGKNKENESKRTQRILSNIDKELKRKKGVLGHVCAPHWNWSWPLREWWVRYERNVC